MLETTRPPALRFRLEKLEAWVTGASVPAYFEAREASQITKGALSIKGWG